MADLLGHAAHDPVLVAAAVGRAINVDWPQSCGACSDLFIDLAALRIAIPTGAIPPRRRDFALTIADARRLRPSWIRRAFHGIGSTRDVLTRPLAASVLGLGMAGLLVGVVPAVMPASSGVAGLDARGGPPGATPAVPTRETTDLGGPVVDAKVSPGELTPDAMDGIPAPSPLTLLSASLLAVGGGLLGLRRLASDGSSMR